MAENSLKSFKIADTQKPQVKQPAKPKAAEAEESSENGSLGFARIEALLDQETPEQVKKNLAALLGRLVDLEGSAKTQKARAGVKRAKVAVERTSELLEYLFKTKESMQEAVEASILGTEGKK